jgi:hypothetical protein
MYHLYLEFAFSKTRTYQRLITPQIARQRDGKVSHLISDNSMVVLCSNPSPSAQSLKILALCPCRPVSKLVAQLWLRSLRFFFYVSVMLLVVCPDFASHITCHNG